MILMSPSGFGSSLLAFCVVWEMRMYVNFQMHKCIKLAYFDFD